MRNTKDDEVSRKKQERLEEYVDYVGVGLGELKYQVGNPKPNQ